MLKGVPTMFFLKKDKKSGSSPDPSMTYDPAVQEPVLRCSICNGEQVAGFKNKKTGAFSEVMFIRSNADLEAFRSQYNIQGEIKKIY